MLIFVCMYVCMSVCLYVCMYVCMYVCVCIYIYMYIYIYIYIYICLHTCVYLCHCSVCVCLDVCMYVCMYVCMFATVCMHVWIYVFFVYVWPVWRTCTVCMLQGTKDKLMCVYGLYVLSQIQIRDAHVSFLHALNSYIHTHYITHIMICLMCMYPWPVCIARTSVCILGCMYVLLYVCRDFFADSP